MGVVYLGLLLHFYQPPGQISPVLRRIVQESYLPLIEVFNQYPVARASFNMNGVTTEMLDDHNYHKVIAGLAGLAAAGKVEITGSGKFHPILPLIPRDEAARQIALNDETNARRFGEVYRPRGFFPPELAWDHALAPLVATAGRAWVLLSGIACPVEWPVDRIYREAAGEGRALALLFRDDILSNKISFRNTSAAAFLEEVRGRAAPDSDRYVVIAMDAETYGHHLHGWEREFLGRLFELLAEQSIATVASASRPLVRLVTLSELVAHFPKAREIVPKAASWSTTKEDLDHHSPYPLWRHRGNELHRLLWRHLEQTLAIFAIATRHADDDNGDLSTARAFTDMALHSDQFWWASHRPHWSANLVHRGLAMQRDVILNSMRAINLSDAPEEARRDAADRVAIARDLADRITDRLFWD